MGGVAFGLAHIGQLHVAVTDVERATEFYRDRLGLPFLYAYPGMAFFDCDGVRLFLSVPEGIDDQGSSTLYFTVPEIRAAVTALEARGVDFTDGPHVVHRTPESELWMAFLKDPDGNVIALMSEVPTS
jgi:catechol 2,3-dioxygenase-like lactoylglutathione lyase family enzyme